MLTFLPYEGTYKPCNETILGRKVFIYSGISELRNEVGIFDDIIIIKAMEMIGPRKEALIGIMTSQIYDFEYSFRRNSSSRRFEFTPYKFVREMINDADLYLILKQYMETGRYICSWIMDVL